MRAFSWSTLSALFLAFPPAHTQDDYTVWASVVFARTGEHTPGLWNPETLTPTLTSVGAHQMYSLGSYFRDRYISSAPSTDGISSAPLYGLSANSVDNDQVYVAALDQQWAVASAQAFTQGLYPPFMLNSSVATVLNSTSRLANGSYLDYPLSGYQYAQIHAVSAVDEQFPFLGGSLDCPAFNVAAGTAASLPVEQETANQSQRVYQAIGSSFLASVMDESEWGYENAYVIFDYLNYQNNHDVRMAALLSDPQYVDPETDVPYLSELRWYADQQQFAQLGNLTQVNDYTGNAISSTDGVVGSISTIAGNLLAAQLLGQLQMAIATQGEYYKLSLLFGDYDPMLSLFALTGLPNLDSNFYGLPDFGSVVVFELFSRTSNSTADGDMSFPADSDLWVRFYFQNGTTGENENGNFQSYPLFNYGPSQTDLPWSTFAQEMYEISVGNIGNWCTACGAETLFCAAWNSSLTASGSSTGGGTCLELKASQNGMHPAVAGVIGAVVTLAVAALLFALAMLVGGVRFHRVPWKGSSELGGFKGSQKLASDRDLTIPKGDAVVGATVESPTSPTGGRERVGSWELKDAEAGRPNLAAVPGDEHRESLDVTHEDGVDPFRDPVTAKETV